MAASMKIIAFMSDALVFCMLGGVVNRVLNVHHQVARQKSSAMFATRGELWS
jgi:hypothetical protein